MTARGQALIEFALVLPVMLVLILGTIDAGDLGLRRLAWQNTAETLASWAAMRPADVPGAAWDALVANETTRTDCAAPTAVADWYDDDLGDRHPGSRVVVTLTCEYHAPAPVPGFSTLTVAVSASEIVQ